MKILKIDGIAYVDLTADNTIISVDSIIITADMIEYFMLDNKIVLVPRIYPELGEKIIVKLRHEISNNERIVDNEFIYSDGLMNLYINEPTLKNKEKYEINIEYNGKNIYRGKLLVVNMNTDIQNYTHAKIENNKIKY